MRHTANAVLNRVYSVKSKYISKYSIYQFRKHLIEDSKKNQPCQSPSNLSNLILVMLQDMYKASQVTTH